MFTAGKAKVRTRKLICSAINSRRVIEFYYHGGYRSVEPFCLGVVIAGDADNESLLCYQIGGYSEFGVPLGWKLFRASEISDLEVTGRHFSGARAEYDPDNIDMATIFCSVIPDAAAEREPPKAAEPVPNMAGEGPSYRSQGETEPPVLSHNELMRKFRFTHPVPLHELYTTIFV